MDLKLSEAHTKEAPKYQAPQNDLVFENASSAHTATDDYFVQARANYAGIFTITQDGKELVSDKKIKAGELFSYEADIDKASANFEISFTATEGPDSQASSS